ncbi:MAG: hypothetical protein F4Y18_03720 [Cenarchaeum sp. SB0663_bin_5]|nr:hypothetical protein [Cenarchaeum sp. SB0663_bin_5]
MRLSAEQVQGIAELREKLQERLEQLRQEVDMTILNIDALDAALTQSSFTRASEYTPPPKAEPEPPKAEPEPPKAEPEPPKAEPEPTVSSTDDVSTIMVNDSAIGGISTSADKITIKLYVPVSAKTPPFETFFISRIIGGMMTKDAVEVEGGRLSKDLAIRYELKTQDDTLDQIIIYNYRLEARAREINSTIRWALSRMLEHVQ